ncbi:MAG TPA: hypothetical protein VNJ29_02590 [Candidatus Nitrosotenuis sp.]|nr:hypothetical protein [Candidatus Nitrosotenuis sp.]
MSEHVKKIKPDNHNVHINAFDTFTFVRPWRTLGQGGFGHHGSGGHGGFGHGGFHNGHFGHGHFGHFDHGHHHGH